MHTVRRQRLPEAFLIEPECGIFNLRLALNFAEEFTGVGPGETDVFKASDGIRNLSLNKTFFEIGEDVRLLGGTLHGDYAYGVTTLPCPPIPDNTPLGGGAVFNTDSTGSGNDIIAVCAQPGCYISYVGSK